jgi:tRNA A-37 threonylcarbamoyl transferase component Bud32
MPDPSPCPHCGAPLPEDAPAGLCPICLVQAGVESGNSPELSSGEVEPANQPTMKSPAGSGAAFEPLSIEDLAPLFPHLEILGLLGKGGMGAVYKARQRGLDRLVAVKILSAEISRNPAFAERFMREARALARLSHPHIVAVYDVAEVHGLHSIVMEYVEGVNLRQTMQTAALTPEQALAIVPQICEALQFAHDEGIVHRDIKPENILIDKKGRVKIADFGLAKLVGQEAREQVLTATHQVMGTRRYMAPEQMLGSRAVDHRADIYSLGVVFYELLTGELPMGKFAPPSKRVHVDVRLDEIVLRALEQQPEQRYQQASQIKTDVELVTGMPRGAAAVPATARGGAENGELLLLDETDRSARRLQHFALIGGLIWIASGVALAIAKPDLLPLTILLWAGGAGLLVVAERTRQQWEVEYRGHDIRFENSVFTSGRLLIDGKTVASGGIGLWTELSGRLPEDHGARERIVARTRAGLFSYRCRLYVVSEPPASHEIMESANAARAAHSGVMPGFWFVLGVALFAAGLALPRQSAGFSPGMILAGAGIICWIAELIRARRSK